MVPAELWNTGAPRGWESEGPQMGGTGSSERMSAYLASLGISEPYPTVLAFWGQGIGSKEPLSRLVGGGRGGGGRREWLSTPPTYCLVCCFLPLFCMYAHLFLVHPLNGMFHLSWKPGGAESEEKLSVQEKPLFGAWNPWDQIPLQMTSGRNGTSATEEEDPWRTRQSWTQAHSP